MCSVPEFYDGWALDAEFYAIDESVFDPVVENSQQMFNFSHRLYGQRVYLAEYQSSIRSCLFFSVFSVRSFKSSMNVELLCRICVHHHQFRL